jgi:hypothetical protein
MRGSAGTVGVAAAGALVFTMGLAASAEAAVTEGGGPLQLGPPTVLSMRQAGPNEISDQQGVLVLGGTVSGAGSIVVHVIDHPDGVENITATWTCTCTVDGTTGSVTARFEGKDNGTAFTGTFTLAGGGTLDGLHGRGTFGGSDQTGGGSYTLAYVG